MHAADHIRQGKKDLRRDPKRDMAVILSETDNEGVVLDLDREGGILTIYVLESQEASENQKQAMEHVRVLSEHLTVGRTGFFHDEPNKEAILVLVSQGNQKHFFLFKVKEVKQEVW